MPLRSDSQGIRPIPDHVATRALTRAVPGPNGCVVSTYSVASHGYAQIGWHDPLTRDRVGTTAHRAAWVARNGQIPEGATIDHLCKNRRCVNPYHLRMLSNFENARRTSGRDWPLGQCVNGHSNVLIVRRGRKRVCSICSANWQRRYREKKGSRDDAA